MSRSVREDSVRLSWRTTLSRRAVASCVLTTLLLLAVGARTAHADVVSAPNHNSSINFDKYTLFNNEWGKAYNGWGDGYETIYRDTNNTSGAWSVDFNWWNVLSDDEWHIKAWPSIIDGWQYGYGNGNTDLPIQLWNNQHIYTGWDYNLNATNLKADVAYDLWIDANPNPSGTPTDEVMIWLYRTNSDADHGLGSDTYVETATIGGTNWRVYRSTSGRQVIWFVRETPTFSTDFDISDFMGYLQWAKGWIHNYEYLLSVQAGTEIWRGSGQLNTTRYYVNITN